MKNDGGEVVSSDGGSKLEKFVDNFSRKRCINFHPLFFSSKAENVDKPDEILIRLPTDGGYGIVIVLMSFVINMIANGILIGFGKLLTEFSH